MATANNRSNELNLSVLGTKPLVHAMFFKLVITLGIRKNVISFYRLACSKMHPKSPRALIILKVTTSVLPLHLPILHTIQKGTAVISAKNITDLK